MSDNRDLQDERISKLYKLGEQSEPPEHLDREIKSAARQITPAKKRNYRWPSLATAAVLVLSISLVLKVMQQEPLEEATINSTPNGELSSQGAVLLEEAEKKLDMESSEKLKQQRKSAVRQRSAPVPAKPEAADATQFEVAPAVVGELDSRRAEALECSKSALAETDSQEEWIKQYQVAIESGKLELARCLKDAYRAKFKTAMPEPPE